MPAEGSPLAKSSDLQRPLLNSPAVSNRIKSSTVVLYRYFFFFFPFLDYMEVLYKKHFDCTKV